MIKPIKDKEEYNNIFSCLKDGGISVNVKGDAKKRLKRKASHFCLINEKLYLKDNTGLHKLAFISDETELMYLEAQKLHNTNHFGMNRLESLCNYYFFKIPRDIIRLVVKNCIICNQSLPLKRNTKLKHITASVPMEHLMIDLIDMREYKNENDGYSWILSCLDVYSKFGWTFPLKSKTGIEVTSVLENNFLLFGFPQKLHSDNGKEFCNAHLIRFCEKNKICFRHGRPRHPQAQRQVERFNQTITRYLQKHILEINGGNDNGSKRWIDILRKVTYEYNVAKHSATQKSPFQLLFGFPGFNTVIYDNQENIVLSDEHDLNHSERQKSASVVSNQEKNSDINLKFNSSKDVSNNEIEEIMKFKNDHQNIISVSSKYLERMDRNSNVHSSKYDFKIGDIVLLANDFDNNKKHRKKKLSSFFSKKYTIIKICSNERAIIKDDDEEKLVSMSVLKKI